MNFLKRVWARVTTGGKYIFSPRRPFWAVSGTVVDEDSAMRVAAFYRGLIYISTQIAKLPWDLKDVNNNIINNNISNLLNLCPNPEMNAFRWRLVMVQTAIIHGNSFAEIERDGAGRPIALWPLDTTRMDVQRTTSGSLVYVYRDPTKGTVFLQPRDVYHLPNFHTKDGIMGQGVVAYGREVLGIQIAADVMAAGMFHNSGIPSGVLEYAGVMDDETYKRVKDSWNEQNGGRKSGSTTILEQGMKYTPIKIEPDVLQFLESRKFGVLEISRFFGVPPTKLYDVTAATYSNVEQSNLEVATDTLDAWTTNLELEADVKILSNRHGGRFTDIDLYSVFRGDMKSRSDYFKTMMSVAAMTPNQIRSREGLPGYGPIGDNYYIATNNLTPVSRMDEVIDADISRKTNSGRPAEQSEEEKELARAAADFLSKK